MSDLRKKSVLIIGANGGVGKTLINLLLYHHKVKFFLDQINSLFLVDQHPIRGLPTKHDKLHILEPNLIDSISCITKLIKTYHIDLVIELAEVETIDCIVACHDSGADYISTSYEVWQSAYETQDSPRNKILIRAKELLPNNRPKFKKGSFLVGSGMNPGIVNALSKYGLSRFAMRCGVKANPIDLELYSIIITESDTTQEIKRYSRKNSYEMSWNPRQSLNEMLEPKTGYIKAGKVYFLDHKPISKLYRARCFDKIIEGFLVPHDEVVTIGELYSGLDVAYIYQVLPSAFKILKNKKMECASDNQKTHQLYPPYATNIIGEDTVGVLFCSRKYGEFWIGFQNYVNEGLLYNSNATLLQVAAGVIAGWKLMESDKGLHLVEELDENAYLKTVTDILGPIQEFWDPDAPLCRMVNRQVRNETSNSLPSHQKLAAI
jgi:homospermidine synthase